MKFIKSLLNSLLTSMLLMVIIFVAGISYLQKKFPPSLTETERLFDTVQKAFGSNIALYTKMREEGLQQNSVKLDAGEPQKKVDTVKARLDQSEYKIRLLEYEVTILKEEVKKLKTKAN